MSRPWSVRLARHGPNSAFFSSWRAGLSPYHHLKFRASALSALPRLDRTVHEAATNVNDSIAYSGRATLQRVSEQASGFVASDGRPEQSIEEPRSASESNGKQRKARRFIPWSLRQRDDVSQLAQSGCWFFVSQAGLNCRLDRTLYKQAFFQHLTLPKNVEYRQAGLHILVTPIVTLFKSKATLNALTTFSRVALTLLPLSLRAKAIHVVRVLASKPGASSTVRWLGSLVGNKAPTRAGRINAALILPILLMTPVVLFLASIASSAEKVPVTGRTRFVLLSPEEEASLVDAVVQVGKTQNGTIDWITVLNHVMGTPEEGFTADGHRLFMGAAVLDERDWRVRWTRTVMLRLLQGSQGLAQPVVDGVRTDLHPPPTSYPLGVDRSGSDFDLIVLDRPSERNAFSFGFGPREANAMRKSGVVVVYSGFLNEILGAKASPDNFVVQQQQQHQHPQATSKLSHLFAPPGKTTYDTTVPRELPSAEQCRDLAVLLSHELSHLLLSHTLESFVNSSVLVPHISKVATDVFRTLIYPFTALLGPFVNDAIGQSLQAGSSDGFSLLGRISASCESLKLEKEADLVGLRLLSYAGIDPRCAISFWEKRLERSADDDHHHHDAAMSAAHHFHMHSSARPPAPTSTLNPCKLQCSFANKTHPENEKRLANIRRELDHWIAYRAVQRNDNATVTTS